MKRRTFLSLSCAAAAAAPRPLPIAAVEFVRYTGSYETLAGVDGQHQNQPLHLYDQFRPKPYADARAPKPTRATVRAIYLRIRTEGGPDGLYGPIDTEAAIVVQQQLASFLKGKDALAGEALWDQMFRLNRHSRTGHFLMAISAVDNALWDVRGRYFQTPVYRLLGGPTRSAVRAYGSCLGFSLEPDALARKARELKQQGYLHQKWFPAYGPGDGAAGFQKNVDLVRILREAVGDDVDLMFDAYQSWQLDYAIQWARRVEQFRPRWIEEAVPADKIEAFAELRRATSIPVASGEHIYGRHEAARYLRAGALSVLQCDPEWCGGLTEIVRICAIASLHDAQVIPHGHSIHSALHLIASQPPDVCPLLEYLIPKMRSYYHFEKRQFTPVNGLIELPDAPGFGIEIDPARVEKQESFPA